MSAMPRRVPWRLRRLLLLGIITYLALAYLVVPALWRRHERHPGLAATPFVTRTSADLPGDPLNVALVGTRDRVVAALEAAGWHAAAPLGLRADLGIAESVLLDRPDPTAPVSDLYLFGRREDLAFEQEFGRSARERHHVRFWRSDRLDDAGRLLWLGAATFDVGVGVSHTTGQITHHIAPDLDAERDGLLAALADAGQLAGRYGVAGIGPTADGRNGGGDRYTTDGMLAVGVLRD